MIHRPPLQQAVVLVSGRGTRLGPLTRATPKPLLPVAGRPLLRWVVDEVRRQGIERIVLLAGFAGDQVTAELGGEPGVTVRVEPEPLGTGGALRFAADDLDERFLLMNGDSLFDINLWDLAGGLGDGAAAMALRRVPDGSRYGAATLEGDRITGFRSNVGPGPGTINGGSVVLSRMVLDRIAGGRPVSIEAEVYPALAAAGLLRGRVYDRPFIDIGVPEDFARAPAWIARTLTRGAVIFSHGVLNRDVGPGHRADQVAWVEGAAAAVNAVNDAGLLAFVATDPADVAHGYHNEARVRSLHAWMNAALMAQGAHIDAFVHSPLHPESRMEASRADTPCRKADPGMTLALLDPFLVDLSRTAVVVEKLGDVQAARTAGFEGLLFEGGDLGALVRSWVAKLAP